MSLRIPESIQILLFSSKILKEKSHILLGIIFGIALYIPFEDLITAWLPLPSIGKALLRFIPELIIYALFARVLYIHYNQGLSLKKTPIDPLLALFFVSSIISVVVNQSNPIRSLNYLRLVWRYLSIYYIIVNIYIPIKKIDYILSYLRRMGILQGLITSIQFFIPANLKVALAAGECRKALSKGASCGSFIDSATLSGFLLITIIVLIAHCLRKEKYNFSPRQIFAFVSLSLFGLFASKKRAALVVAAVIPALAFSLLKRRKIYRIYLWVGFSLMIILVFVVPILVNSLGLVTQDSLSVQSDVSSYFLRLFSSEYWGDFFLNARGWFLANIWRTVIQAGHIFGLGPDLSKVIDHMSLSLDKATDIVKLQRDQFVFYDPYWFAQLAFFGIPGLGLYWSVLWSLYKTSLDLVDRSLTKEYSYLGVIFCVLIVVGFLYSFVERLFMLRTFSFYFWMIAGLVVNTHNTIEIPRKYNNQVLS